MTGQDAGATAKAFNAALPLHRVLAKADGDARGGAALSVRAICGKPIKFLGVGEDEWPGAVHPDRIASRILGMGDMQCRETRNGAMKTSAKAEQQVRIAVDWDGGAALARLCSLARRGGRIGPLMPTVSEHLKASVDRSFEEQGEPRRGCVR